MESNYFILITVFVLCLFLRTGYELLKEAGKIDPTNKFTFAIIFGVMCTLWISWFLLCPIDPTQGDLPNLARWIGLAFFGIGLFLAVGALAQLRGLENIDHLVTTGLFSKIRHPMYTGFILWILGWSTYHSAIVSLAVGLIGIVNILYWRHLEETRLHTQYGNAYLQYQRTTWF